MEQVRIIGRDREIAQLELALGSGHDGLRIAMLSGPSGQGKTTLAHDAVDRARARGFRTAEVRGRAGSLSTPFRPFLDAMPEFAVLLDVLASPGGSVDVEHAGIAAVNVITALTQEQPLLLVFDDAQALDESSIALMPYLTGISESTNLTVLFVEQTDAVGIPASYRSFVDGVLARRIVGHVQLGKLADEAIHAIIVDDLELEDDASVPAEIVVRAQGNPWFAKELAASWRAGTTELPTTIATAATTRLYALPEAAQELVSAVSLCAEGAHVGWLEALSGERPRAFVALMDQLLSSGLIREDGEVLTIAHPLMQQALVAEMSAAMRRAVHAELAEVAGAAQLSDLITCRARGYHLAAAGRAFEAVAEYLRAADAHEIKGQVHESYADLTRALANETRIDARIDLLRRCATMAMQVDLEHAETLWIEMGRIAASSGDDETYAFALFQQYWTCDDGSARDRLERAAALGVEQYGWSARAAANIASLDGDFVQAEALDRRALDIAVAREDLYLKTLATHRLGVSLAILGRAPEAIDTLRSAVHLAIQNRLHAWATTAWGDLVEMLSLELRVTDALDESRAALKYVDDLGLDRLRSNALTRMSWSHLRAGDVDAARDASVAAHRAAAESPDPHEGPFVALVYALIALEANDHSAAQAITDLAQVLDQANFAAWNAMLDALELRASARGGSLQHATSRIVDVMERMDEMTDRADLAVWFARTAVLSRDTAAIEHLPNIARLVEPGVAFATLAHDELAALSTALADATKLQELEQVSDRWARAGRTLDAVRVNALIGAIRFGAGDAAGAKDILHTAKTALQKCGAAGDADLVASLLRQTGARSRATSRTTNVGPLTKRELEIAHLVASGLKNSEVAGTLFLAEKTVAAHLSNIYGKVEVRSRVQLTAWIRENDPSFEPMALASIAG